MIQTKLKEMQTNNGVCRTALAAPGLLNVVRLLVKKLISSNKASELNSRRKILSPPDPTHRIITIQRCCRTDLATQGLSIKD